MKSHNFNHLASKSTLYRKNQAFCISNHQNIETLKTCVYIPIYNAYIFSFILFLAIVNLPNMFALFLFVGCLKSLSCPLSSDYILVSCLSCYLHKDIKMPEVSPSQWSSFVKLFCCMTTPCDLGTCYIHTTPSKSMLVFNISTSFICLDLPVYPEMFITWENCVFNYVHSG